MISVGNKFIAIEKVTTNVAKSNLSSSEQEICMLSILSLKNLSNLITVSFETILSQASCERKKRRSNFQLYNKLGVIV